MQLPRRFLRMLAQISGENAEESEALGRLLVVAALLMLAGGTAWPQERTPNSAAARSGHPDFAAVLNSITRASFPGTSQDAIQATAADAAGNVYVAGTTYSAQFPVRNAQQRAFGDTTILRSDDLGAAWIHVNDPPGGHGTSGGRPHAGRDAFCRQQQRHL